MLALKKLQTTRIKKDPNDPNDDDDQIIAKEAEELGTAFDRAIDLLANGSLYGTQIGEIVRRILRQYTTASTIRMGRGTANEEWSSVKIKHAHVLEAVVEDAMKDVPSGPDSGRIIQANLLRGIESYKTEYLPSARKAFYDEHKSEPRLGTLESTYIPAIEKSIDIVFRVYRLFQIENRTDADFRITGDGCEDAVKLVQAAHKMAKDATEILLNDYSKESTDLAMHILTSIQAQYRELLRTNTAAKGKQAGAVDAMPGVDRVQLFHVHELFTRKFDDIKQEAINNASHNLGTFAKNIVLGAAASVATTVSVLGNTGSYLTEKVCDLMITTEGPKIKQENDSAESDYFPDPSSPMEADLSEALHELYMEENEKSTSHTYLNLSPNSMPRKTPTPSPENNNNKPNVRI